MSASEGKKTLGGDTKSSLFYILIRDYGALEATKSMTRLSKLCARFLGMSTKCEDEWVHCWKKGKKEEGKEGRKDRSRKEGRKKNRSHGWIEVGRKKGMNEERERRKEGSE